MYNWVVDESRHGTGALDFFFPFKKHKNKMVHQDGRGWRRAPFILQIVHRYQKLPAESLDPLTPAHSSVIISSLCGCVKMSSSVIPIAHRLYILSTWPAFQVGLPVIENIVGCVENSAKFLMVLSNSFLASRWCIFETYVAQQASPHASM